MKLEKVLIGLQSIILFFIFGCNSQSMNNLKTNTVIIGKCKKDIRYNKEGVEIIASENYISYKYKNSKLFITHHNSSFYCYDKNSISVKIERKDNIINIKEIQQFPNGSTRCSCLHDLNITINNINIDTYEINIYNNTTDDVSSFTINIENKKEDFIYA